jgi:hypothetical protein
LRGLCKRSIRFFVDELGNDRVHVDVEFEVRLILLCACAPGVCARLYV